MSWILDINKDVLPIIAPLVPSKYHKLIPKRLVKRLGDFDPERWTKVLKYHRVNMMMNEHDIGVAVVAEYDEDDDSIFLQITDSKSESLVFEVIQAIMHETIHANQFQEDPNRYYRRTHKLTNDVFIDYLALHGEVEAFGHCLFLESMDRVDIASCPTSIQYRKVPDKVQRKLRSTAESWRKLYKTSDYF